MIRRLVSCTAGCLILLVSVVSAQSNWPQFRGETAGVVADDPRLPDSWGPNENIVWSIDVPGTSWSSPIVWDEHVFIVTATRVDGEDNPVSPADICATIYRGLGIDPDMHVPDSTGQPVKIALGGKPVEAILA